MEIKTHSTLETKIVVSVSLVSCFFLFVVFYYTLIETTILAIMWYTKIALFIGLIGSGVGLGFWGYFKYHNAKLDLEMKRVDIETRCADIEMKRQIVKDVRPNQLLYIRDINGERIIEGQKVTRQLDVATPLLEKKETTEYRQDDWISDTVFDGQGNLKIFHVKADGATGTGKTYLMLHLIWLLQKPHPHAEYWLSDPKFEGESSGWPFTPFITDFDQVSEGAEYLYQNVVTARKHAKREGTPPSHPAFLIFDEVDGCFDEHGEKFTKPVRRGIKEGRSGWAHYFLAGQSPLAKDAGFSGALFRNTARFVLGSEAMAFIRNPQFSFYDNTLRQAMMNQLAYLQEHKKRYALVIPPSGQGLPFVGLVPHLKLPDFSNMNLVQQNAIDFANNAIITKNTSGKVDKKELERLEVAYSKLKAEQGGSFTRSDLAIEVYGHAGGIQLSKIDNSLDELGLTINGRKKISKNAF